MQEDPQLPYEPSLKESSAIPSITHSPPASAAAVSDEHTAGADSAFSPNASVYLRVSAHLGRLALHASARASDEFWPPPEISQAPSRTSVDRNVSLLTDVPEDVQMIGDERPLISIVAEGGLLRYQQVRELRIPGVLLAFHMYGCCTGFGSCDPLCWLKVYVNASPGATAACLRDRIQGLILCAERIRRTANQNALDSKRLASFTSGSRDSMRRLLYCMRNIDNLKVCTVLG